MGKEMARSAVYATWWDWVKPWRTSVRVDGMVGILDSNWYSIICEEHFKMYYERCSEIQRWTAFGKNCSWWRRRKLATKVGVNGRKAFPLSHSLFLQTSKLNFQKSLRRRIRQDRSNYKFNLCVWNDNVAYTAREIFFQHHHHHQSSCVSQNDWSKQGPTNDGRRETTLAWPETESVAAPKIWKLSNPHRSLLETPKKGERGGWGGGVKS